MAIIAVLASLMVTAIVAARKTAENTRRVGNAKTIEIALETFFSNKGRYPIYNVGSDFDCVDAAFENGVTGEASGCLAASRQNGVVKYLVAQKALSSVPNGLSIRNIAFRSNATGSMYTLVACDSRTTEINSNGITVGSTALNATPICTNGNILYITAR
jgi:type II secretory pathway pseudopilin PulG